MVQKYNRQTIVDRLHQIPGIHLSAVSDYTIIFKDGRNKEYSIRVSDSDESIESILNEVENSAVEYKLTQVEDLSRSRLESIVRNIVDIMNDSSQGSARQLIKIITILKYYKLMR